MTPFTRCFAQEFEARLHAQQDIFESEYCLIIEIPTQIFDDNVLSFGLQQVLLGLNQLLYSELQVKFIALHCSV